jgi:ubiquinone/menaquinone biosynthesis C-methylase UbiE
MRYFLTRSSHKVTFLALLGVAVLGAQAGPIQKLAPYVPTPQDVVDKMLDLAQLKPGEKLYDLGSGDGRIVITAARDYRAKAVGVEISEQLYRQAKQRISDLRLDKSVSLVHGNLMDVDLKDADVVTLYLLTDANEKLKPKLESLKPGARVVSHDFEIRHWIPETTEKVEAHKRTHTIYVYRMPPKRLDQ